VRAKDRRRASAVDRRWRLPAIGRPIDRNSGQDNERFNVLHAMTPRLLGVIPKLVR